MISAAGSSYNWLYTITETRCVRRGTRGLRRTARNLCLVADTTLTWFHPLHAIANPLDPFLLSGASLAGLAGLIMSGWFRDR